MLNNKVLWKGKPHIFLYIISECMSKIGVVLPFSVFFLGVTYLHTTTPMPPLIYGGFSALFLSPLCISLLIIAGRMIEYINFEFIVTDEGVEIHKGIISREIMKLSFTKIAKVSTWSNRINKRLSCGTVIIKPRGQQLHTDSDYYVYFTNIPEHQRIADLIRSKIPSSD